MMDDLELAEHIENLREEAETSFEEDNLLEYSEAQEMLRNAVEDAVSRGFESIEQMKESI